MPRARHQAQRDQAREHREPGEGVVVHEGREVADHAGPIGRVDEPEDACRAGAPMQQTHRRDEPADARQRHQDPALAPIVDARRADQDRDKPRLQRQPHGGRGRVQAQWPGPLTDRACVRAQRRQKPSGQRNQRDRVPDNEQDRRPDGPGQPGRVSAARREHTHQRQAREPAEDQLDRDARAPDGQGRRADQRDEDQRGAGARGALGVGGHARVGPISAGACPSGGSW